MVPCCDRCGQQYFNEDRTVNSDWLIKKFNELAHVEKREDTESVWGKLVFAKRGWYPTLTIVIDGTDEHNLCGCNCHVIGSTFMH
ncbi:hypothetical protein MZD04_gp414 [Pseudomonas phage Psa21]|uniref:Uncharacterized protein n=1 Tax=Pseudomonas phage Psa21 TaxID=2530023 RepID=A0A481W6P7_9CAUD|nr:hypothetical protein MZD04_gp414 [Pseudomonas phage Psa21]QBJ02934.1 hypothetical protein PSA21_412 [Pseudomonas phage Psa21]